MANRTKVRANRPTAYRRRRFSRLASGAAPPYQNRTPYHAAARRVITRPDRPQSSASAHRTPTPHARTSSARSLPSTGNTRRAAVTGGVTGIVFFSSICLTPYIWYGAMPRR